MGGLEGPQVTQLEILSHPREVIPCQSPPTPDHIKEKVSVWCRCQHPSLFFTCHPGQATGSATAKSLDSSIFFFLDLYFYNDFLFTARAIGFSFTVVVQVSF